MNILALAYKNLWRNRRRTLITVMSVVFAVFLSTLMRSMQEGTYTAMIDNVVKFYSGYVQVHDSAYWDDKTIDNAMLMSDSQVKGVASLPHVTSVAGRLESFSLISNDEFTKGTLVTGIDVEGEERITGLSRWVKSGSYLSVADSGVLLAVNLARHLNVEPGDSVVLLSQGYQGATAAAIFPVRGIVEFAMPMLNLSGVYMSLPLARQFFSADSLMTSLVVMTDDYKYASRIEQQIQNQIGVAFDVMTWDQMSPELVQFIESDRSSGVIMMFVLYLVIGFGILGTVIMMIAERRREFGVMTAIGMKKSRLTAIILFETLIMAAFGVALGFAFSMPIIFYLTHNPIPLWGDVAEIYEQFGFEPVIYFSMRIPVFLSQAATVFFITLAIGIYPVWNILKMNTVKALR